MITPTRCQLLDTWLELSTALLGRVCDICLVRNTDADATRTADVTPSAYSVMAKPVTAAAALAQRTKPMVPKDPPSVPSAIKAAQLVASFWSLLSRGVIALTN